MEKQPGKYPKATEETAAALGCAQMANCCWQRQQQLLGPKANSTAPCQAPARPPSEVSAWHVSVPPSKLAGKGNQTLLRIS